MGTDRETEKERRRCVEERGAGWGKEEAVTFREKKKFQCSKQDRNTPVEQTFTVKDEK